MVKVVNVIVFSFFIYSLSSAKNKRFKHLIFLSEEDSNRFFIAENQAFKGLDRNLNAFRRRQRFMKSRNRGIYELFINLLVLFYLAFRNLF